LGGTFYITETIKHHLSREEKDPLAKVENLLYLSLFRSSEQAKDLEIPGRGPLIGKKLPLENILSCRKVLEEVKGLPLEIFQAISSQFQEVRGIKVSLSDGTTFYLDSQLHTVWSTPHIPYDFSNSAYYLKRYLNKYFQEDKPLVIFMAPGYDSPTKEFFDFMVGLDEASRRIVRLSLFGNKFEELGEIPAGQRVKKHFYAFGLGPWQFREYRKVSKMGEFRKFYFAPLKEDFYIAEVEMELSRPNQNKTIALTGCALKRKPDEKTRLVILSNMVIGGARIEELANIYLSRWPNLEEAFQDFSQKIELFTYTASSQRFFSTEGLDLNREAPVDINAIFGYYLKVLDLYARWHFLPADYEDKDFAAMKEQFYALPGQWNKENGYLFVNFKPAAGFLFLEHLKYACRRINEREIVFPDGHKLCCSVG
jgi:hypothetical protein